LLPWCVTLATLGAFACATHDPSPAKPHPKLESFWRGYEKLADHKAVAVAGSFDDARWTVGAGSGLPDRASAAQFALEECAERRIRARVQAQCVLYAEGAKIVWRGY